MGKGNGDPAGRHDGIAARSAAVLALVTACLSACGGDTTSRESEDPTDRADTESGDGCAAAEAAMGSSCAEAGGNRGSGGAAPSPIPTMTSSTPPVMGGQPSRPRPPEGPVASCEVSSIRTPTGCESFRECQVGDQLVREAAVCERQGTDGATCTCTMQDGGRVYMVSDFDEDASCAQVFGLCDSEDLPEFEPGPDYQPTFSGSSSACELDLSCTLVAEVATGIQQIQTENRSVSCESTGAVGAVCSCGDGVLGQFRFTGAEANLSTCEFAVDVCGETPSVVPDTDVECETTYEDEVVGFCSTQLECDLLATVGENEIALRRNIYVTCEQQGAAWACRCDTGADSFELATPGDEAPCADFALLCPEQVELSVTNP